MNDCMYFPDTVEEFMEQYKMTDTKQVYSNGTEYVPIFRMKQWFEHEKAQLSQEGTTSDLISRQAAIDALARMMPRSYTPDGSHPADEEIFRAQEVFADCIEALEILPPAQPEPTDINAKEAVYNLAEKIGIHQLFALTVELRGEPIQPEPHEGHWIKHIDPSGGEQYECSRCGVLWQFTDGTPEDNEAYFCPKCGKKLITK